MTQIEAIYEHGVFKPFEAVALPEKQRVRLDIQPVEVDDWRTWLEKAEKLQDQIVARRGILPDSTPDIAADRMRDV